MDISPVLEGAFHYAKISGQSGPPPEVVLFDLLVRSDQKLPFHFQTFLLPVLLQLVTTVKMTDGSDLSVYECSLSFRSQT